VAKPRAVTGKIGRQGAVATPTLPEGIFVRILTRCFDDTGSGFGSLSQESALQRHRHRALWVVKAKEKSAFDWRQLIHAQR
jgi:hypothetical protein